jgi:hypothetical protein
VEKKRSTKMKLTDGKNILEVERVDKNTARERDGQHTVTWKRDAQGKWWSDADGTPMVEVTA